MPTFGKSIVLLALCITPGLAFAQNTVGEVFASDASVRGSVVFVGGGTQVLSGSQVAAGASPALLKLKRGGDVRICPGTNLSVATSPEGASLMLSLSSGSIEANYSVKAVADTVLTPDFKMQMIGPGVFHLAIAANTKGDTCVRPLTSNTASVIVTELMGDGTYQVKPGENVVFRGGKITGAQNSEMEGCGCPAPPPVDRTENKHEEKPAPVIASQQAPQDAAVQVDAPFVFRGDAPQPPEMAYSIASLKTRSTDSVALKLQPIVVPPTPEPSAKDRRKAEEEKARAMAKQRELEQREEQTRAKEAARLEKLARKEQQKKDKEAAHLSAAAMAEQARKDKEASHATEVARRQQSKHDKEAAKAAVIATKQQHKQEVEKQKATAREQKIAKMLEQKEQQARARELDMARKQQAKQDQEVQRQAELTRQREQQAAKAEQKRTQEVAKTQQQPVKTEPNSESPKPETNILKKVGSFFGKLFKG